MNSLPDECSREVSHLKGNETLTKSEVERRIAQCYDSLRSSSSRSSKALSAGRCTNQTNHSGPKRHGRRLPQQRAKRSKSGSKRDGEVECFACRAKGHLSRECPFIQCANCNSGGHLAHSCKNPKACVVVPPTVPPLNTNVSQPGMCAFMASSAEPPAALSAESCFASLGEPPAVSSTEPSAALSTKPAADVDECAFGLDEMDEFCGNFGTLDLTGSWQPEHPTTAPVVKNESGTPSVKHVCAFSPEICVGNEFQQNEGMSGAGASRRGAPAAEASVLTNSDQGRLAIPEVTGTALLEAGPRQRRNEDQATTTHVQDGAANEESSANPSARHSGQAHQDGDGESPPHSNSSQR